MSVIYQDLRQFSTYIPPINLTFHQYLLFTSEPILFHTGSVQQATELVPKLKTILGDNNLNYIFVSHFEADECGGLSYLLEHFPQAKAICSEVTARQLTGFGLTQECITKKPGEKLTTESYELEFFSYPSEIHLWEGLLVLEKRRGIFFSSDLMFRFGEASDAVLESNWKTEIDDISKEQVPDPERLIKLQQTLKQLNPNFVATGHGPCLNV
ncbi:MBL fold metallo-hydrolase [Desulfosporosinus sp. FKB]|uniref:MBL fold metallo-hydrolase n=1 Tax=Desulfosporosinus sp. FKB TaxID=1969835 RepID=UPI000B498210|nr:MBL fold metallo-hydrolase [Desulfosporosinus sp. FKB]